MTNWERISSRSRISITASRSAVSVSPENGKHGGYASDSGMSLPEEAKPGAQFRSAKLNLHGWPCPAALIWPSMSASTSLTLANKSLIFGLFEPYPLHRLVCAPPDRSKPIFEVFAIATGAFLQGGLRNRPRTLPAARLNFLLCDDTTHCSRTVSSFWW